MADLDQLETALRNADAAGDTAAAQRLAAAYQAEKAKQVAPAPPETFGQKAENFLTGVGKGAFSLPQNAVELGARATDALGITDGAQARVHAATDAANARALNEAGVSPQSPSLKVGEPVGQVVASAPIAALFPATLPGTLGAGAVTGALSADPNHAGAGALFGAGGGAALHGAGKAIAPHISDAVQALAKEGVTMTPGQIFGGWAKGLEDRASGMWPLNHIIQPAQNAATEGFNRAATNRALAPLADVTGLSPGPGLVPKGMKVTGSPLSFPSELPEGIPVGHDSVKFAGDTLGQAYEGLLPQTQTTLTPEFWNKVGGLAAETARELPPERAAQMQSTLSGVFGRLGEMGDPATSHTVIDGQTMQALDSKLGQLSRNLSAAPDPDQRAMGYVYSSIQKQLRGAVMDSNPALAPQFQSINEGWANLAPVERAAASASGNAAGKAPGVFTPQQLRTAARTGDNSVRDRVTARGDALMQDLAENGIQALPQSIGSSGTSERASLFALPAVAAAAYSHPVGAAAAGLTIPALYSDLGLKAFNELYAHGSSPTMTLLGQSLQNLGRYGAGPAAGSAMDKRK